MPDQPNLISTDPVIIGIEREIADLRKQLKEYKDIEDRIKRLEQAKAVLEGKILPSRDEDQPRKRNVSDEGNAKRTASRKLNAAKRELAEAKKSRNSETIAKAEANLKQAQHVYDQAEKAFEALKARRERGQE
jgi:hypothetical protein